MRARQDDGFIAKLLVESGAKDIAVGTPLLVLVEDEADVGKFGDYSHADGGGQGAEKEAADEAPRPAKDEGGGPDAGECWSPWYGSTDTYMTTVSMHGCQSFLC